VEVEAMKRRISRAFFALPAALAGLLLFSPPAEAAGRVGKRQIRQQARIAQGVRSGELTRRETARLERQQAGLACQKRRMLADGGGLGPVERARLEGRQDRLSRHIYHQKHDQQSRLD
jgi:hypothetical protein